MSKSYENASQTAPLSTFEFVGEIPIRGETPCDLVRGQQQALYRFYDAGGDLLYIGITWNPYSRWRQHARNSPWFGSASRVTCAVYPNEWTALKEEVLAIRAEAPLFNTRSRVT